MKPTDDGALRPMSPVGKTIAELDRDLDTVPMPRMTEREYKDHKAHLERYYTTSRDDRVGKMRRAAYDTCRDIGEDLRATHDEGDALLDRYAAGRATERAVVDWATRAQSKLSQSAQVALSVAEVREQWQRLAQMTPAEVEREQRERFPALKTRRWSKGVPPERPPASRFADGDYAEMYLKIGDKLNFQIQRAVEALEMAERRAKVLAGGDDGLKNRFPELRGRR